MAFAPSMHDILTASTLMRTLFEKTPLHFSKELSKHHGARIFLKREDCTPVRSYKIRGAYNKMNALRQDPSIQSVVTCSAGNHAQGVAYSCDAFKIRGYVYMPKNTTKQKIQRVQQLGGEYVKIFLEGNSFDECYAVARERATIAEQPFIHPFDDKKVIEGQATVAHEIINQINEPIDTLVLPIGGGGLAAGVSSYMRECSPSTQIIGTGPLGAPAMYQSLQQGSIVKLNTIQSFVDGASVKSVGSLNFPIVQKNLHTMLQVDEGHVCSKILQMYNECGLILEPAGVLSLCGLDLMNPSEIKGKTIVAILSGGNSDVFRMPEIFERSLQYEGRKHYYRIEFAQRAGALKDFALNVLGKEDDIIYFRYTKRINQETGPVILGLETKSKEDSLRIERAMEAAGIQYEKLSGQVDL